MSLATLAQLKARQGISDAGQDTLLTAILTGVSGQLSQAAARPLEKATQTETLSVREPGVSILYLKHWPIVTVTEVKEASFKQFDDADALTEDTDFMVDYERGELIRMGFWLKGHLTVQVSYTGGYTLRDGFTDWTEGEGYAVDDLVLYEGVVYICIDAIDPSNTAPPDDTDHWTATSQLPVPDGYTIWTAAEGYALTDLVLYDGAIYICSSAVDPSNTAPPDDEDHWTVTHQKPVPDDIVEACIQQAQFVYQRRETLGLTAAGAQGGSFSAYAQDKLLPGVAETMRAYKRLIG